MEGFDVRTHIKNVIRSVVFLCLLVTSLYYINQMMLPKYILKNNIWPTTSSYNQFYEMDENSIDVIFLGSSVVVNAFSPQEIYNTCGIRSYNLASEEQSIFLSYYWLKEALRFQQPKVVVLDTRFLFPLHYEPTNTIESMTRKCLDPMRWSSVKVEAVDALCDLEINQSRLSYYLTNIRFHSRWTSLEEHDIYLKESQSSELKGFAPTMEEGPDGFEPYVYGGNEEIVAEPHGVMLEYLDKMVELCKQEGVSLALISLPGNTMDDGVYNMLTAYSEKNEVDFYNLSQNPLYEGIDAKLPEENAVGHDNFWGAVKISRFFGNLLKENYQLAAVEDPQYEETKAFYERFRKNMELTRVTDMITYLQTIEKDRYTVFIAVRNDGVSGLTEPIKEELRTLGLQTDFTDKVNWSYCAVVDPQTGVREEMIQGRLQLDGRFRDGNVVYSVVSTGWDSSILIDGMEYSANYGGMNFVVYDNELMKVVDSIGFHTHSSCRGLR